MTPSPHAILLESEGKQLEFKRDLSSPLNVFKTLVAFANSAGGRLVIGADDMHQVVGVANPLAEEERICNLISDAIAPRLLPNVELMSVGDAAVLVPEPHVVEMATGVRPSIRLALSHAVGSNTSASFLTPAVNPAATPSGGLRLELQLESKLAAKMVALLQTQESGKAALSQAFRHRSVSCEPHKQIRRLLDMGQVAMPFPDKPQSRLQRYRLTPQGQALLTALRTPESPAP